MQEKYTYSDLQSKLQQDIYCKLIDGGIYHNNRQTLEMLEKIVLNSLKQWDNEHTQEYEIVPLCWWKSLLNRVGFNFKPNCIIYWRKK